MFRAETHQPTKVVMKNNTISRGNKIMAIVLMTIKSTIYLTAEYSSTLQYVCHKGLIDIQYLLTSSNL